MTPQDYQHRALALGISRGQFESGFRDPTMIESYKITAGRWRPPPKPVPPPITEDLSRFARQKPRQASFYELLSKRGLTREQLAKQVGIAPSYLSRAVAASDHTAVVARKRIRPFLTREEIKLLGW